MSESSVPGLRAEPTATQRKNVVLAARILVGLIIIAAPAYIGSFFIPGLFGVAFYGVIAGGLGWMSGGSRAGVSVVMALAGLGVLSTALHDFPWMLAVLLMLLGVGYGVAAGRGVGKAFVQLPILTPYFMTSPLPLFAHPPTLDLEYYAGIFVVVCAAGLWTVLVLHLAMDKRTFEQQAVVDRRRPLISGAVLGAMSAVVMLIGTSTELSTHWAWITLTLYVLTDPLAPSPWGRMLGRVLGTFAGFALVVLLILAPISDSVLPFVAVPAMWACLCLMMMKRPYWQYNFALTTAVVLMASTGVSTFLVDLERAGFTLIGTALAVLVTVLVTPLARSLTGARPRAK